MGLIFYSSFSFFSLFHMFCLFFLFVVLVCCRVCVCLLVLFSPFCLKDTHLQRRSVGGIGGEEERKGEHVDWT